jgi:hypothetical protein
LTQVVKGRSTDTVTTGANFPNEGRSMATPLKFSGISLAVFLAALVSFSSPVVGASAGNLQGIVQNQAGQPLANVLVTILDRSSEQAIPILTRTNELGRLFIRNIEAGDYAIQVKSTGYVTAGSSGVEITAGKTSIVRLVLQEFLNPEGDGADNEGIKSLLRTPTSRRLVFRNNPDPFGRELDLPSPLFDSAVFQVYTNAGFGDGYLIFPSESINGTSTNFAFVDSFLGNSRYIVAGQLNSGEDSLWRLKNIYQYGSGGHELDVYMGYGRMSFQQPSLALLGNPIAIGNEVDYLRAIGTTKMFNVGFADRLQVGALLAVEWGLEFNQINNTGSDTFLNPNLKISLAPVRGTRINLVGSARRETLANTVALPDGQSVNLDDSMHYARVGDQLSIGTSRYYQAGIAQRLGLGSEVELVGFGTRRFGGTLPFLAVFEFRPGYDVLQVDDEQTGSRGYRLSWHQSFAPGVKGSLSYVRANALGLSPGTLTAVAFDGPSMRNMLRRHDYNLVAAEVEAIIPRSQTTLTALVKLVPDGRPISTLDPYSDSYETGNQGVNLFLRQIIPLPMSLLNFVGLDFLAKPRLEALLDVRNLINHNLGVLHTAEGDIVLVRAPRSVRGGIAVKF